MRPRYWFCESPLRANRVYLLLVAALLTLLVIARLGSLASAVSPFRPVSEGRPQGADLNHSENAQNESGLMAQDLFHANGLRLGSARFYGFAARLKVTGLSFYHRAAGRISWPLFHWKMVNAGPIGGMEPRVTAGVWSSAHAELLNSSSLGFRIASWFHEASGCGPDCHGVVKG